MAGLTLFFLKIPPELDCMRRRFFLKRASATAVVASLAGRGFAGSFADGKQPRVAYGGIGIECSTYSRIRARMEDFTILRGKELTESKRFAFLKNYSVPFKATLVATAVPGGPVETSTYSTIKAEFLEKLKALLPLDGLFLPMHGDVCGGDAGCGRRLDGICAKGCRSGLPDVGVVRSSRKCESAGNR